MPSVPTTTGYALLGLLHVRPWTTYELAKQMQRSLHWFWPRAERRLYDEPKRLVAAGLAVARREHTGLRPRTVYAITDAGRAALRDWLSTPAAGRVVESESILRVFFADAGSLEQLQAGLDRMEAEAIERIDALAGLAETPPDDLPFPERGHITALLLRLLLDEELAVLRWARWARGTVAEWHGAGDPGSWDGATDLAATAARARAAVRGG
ncbi:PadR family transcriptional regulator [Phycicoccus flavus]|uniref:PadR family transcriptional regulator n=1 Tax=Phycicoccus flavus TaxID=2502783 RepID=A0A8T6QYG8_9MICO|nr:PadR family transcriptional regulator [Phycicoccus flavus]NHA66496.1 PadR family transcriptional regulator [Phycicoccus flavus]